MNEKESLGLGRALLVNFALIAVIALFIYFFALIGLKDSWIGFLFLWYYASIKHASKEAWLATVTGSLCGFGMSGLLIYLPTSGLGEQLGFAIFFSAVFLAVLMAVMGRLTIIINEATFLFLTVGCIPFIIEQKGFEEHFVALFVSIGFWSTLIVLVRYLMDRISSPAV